MVRYRDLISDTICSPVTPPGHSGVAVIRISGDESLKLSNQLSVQDLSKLSSHQCQLVDFQDSTGNPIDQVLVTYFEKGRSFTGDQTVEISSHGNPLIINRIVETLLQTGCRQAEKGEFSFRAFYNGKIDLVQAESIHQLVVAKNSFGSEAFLNQLQGELSQEFTNLEDQLVSALSHLEASIDFVEEDIETAQLSIVGEYVENSLENLNSLLKSYSTGKNLSEAFKILFLGATNVGKSSLFNQLLNEDRAIVTEIPGTTRDMVSQQKFIGNHQVEIFDSAGVRETNDLVEEQGIQKVVDFSEKADQILLIIDLSEPHSLPTRLDLKTVKPIFVLNKLDKIDKREAQNIWENICKSNDFSSSDFPHCFVSALTGEGIPELKSTLEELISQTQQGSEGGMVTQPRHYSHLCELKSFLESAKLLISKEESPDLISQELKLGLSEVHSLLGKEYNDEILDKIFSDFCIGK